MLKKYFPCLILIIFITTTWADNQNNLSLEFTYRSYPEKISKELKDKLHVASTDESFRVIVEFDRIIDPSFLYEQVQGMSMNERRTYTINTLQNFTSSYQKDAMKYLERMENSGKVEKLSQLWLTNTIGMRATKEVIEEVAEHPSVALVWLDKINRVFTTKGGSVGNSSPDGRELVWNIQAINADQVWPLGYTGQGIIVGHIDTGVNYNHNDLSDHMWDGSPTYPNHGWDFIGGDDDPMDSNGHGTHTAGTIAGDGTAGCSTGVAPDAQIMALRAIPGFISDMENAATFALTNDANVITMSAGWDSADAGGSWGSLSTSSRYIAANCLSAGVIWSTSAGNGKEPGHYALPYDIGIPANSPAPWYGASSHTGLMAVGATNQGNTIASFSSLGPTDWFFAPWYEYMYPPGLMKPEVVAPGGSPGIKSLSYSNPSGYAGPSMWQGTSMSCPHLTGTIALMLSKNPDLTPKEIDSLVEVTCLDLGTTGRDNTFGAGLIDALAAVNAVPIPGVEEEPVITITPATPSVKCHPNPTRNTTSIRFTLSDMADISIDVHDVSGRRVTTLANGEYESGVHNISWNRKDEKGVRVPQGIYFIRLKSEGIKANTKLIVID